MSCDWLAYFQTNMQQHSIHSNREKPIHPVSATEASGLLCLEQPSLYGDIHIVCMCVDSHLAACLSWSTNSRFHVIMLISGASKYLTLSVYVTVLGLCVCLFVCLHLIEYYRLQGTLQDTTSSFRAMRARKRLNINCIQIKFQFFHIQSHIIIRTKC